MCNGNIFPVCSLCWWYSWKVGNIQLMTVKMEEPIPHMQGWVNGRITIAIVRYHSPMICGACPPTPLHNRELEWESGLGLGLAQ